MVEFVQGSTAVKLRTTLSWAGQNMTTVESVSLDIVSQQTGESITRVASLGTSTATSLIVEYQPEAGELGTPGDYSLQWEATFADGLKMIWPPGGSQTVRINPRLIPQ